MNLLICARTQSWQEQLKRPLNQKTWQNCSEKFGVYVMVCHITLRVGCLSKVPNVCQMRSELRSWEIYLQETTQNLWFKRTTNNAMLAPIITNTLLLQLISNLKT